MILWTTINLLLVIILSLILSNNPLTSGLLILLIALCIASLYSLLISSWFAFLIFLIYIGGILVIFSYFVALSPNQKKITIRNIYILLSILILLLITSNLKTLIFPFPSHTISSLYLPENSIILIFLGLLLLITIIIIVKITNLHKGPLRAFS